MRRTALLSSALLVAAALSGCAAKSDGGGGGSTTTAAGSGSAAAATCTPATLKTQSATTLTVATDSPAYEPWFKDNDPTNGQGFESAVAYAVAQKLGYGRDQVKWVKATFTSVIAPTPKKYDFDVNQVSITPERAKAVDFSSGYYDVAQSVVTLKGSKIASARTIADLSGAKLGAQQGTTSFDAITNQIKPSKKPAEFPTNDLAVQALKNGQIDGLVVDLPTGLYLTAAELDNATIVGQLPVSGSPEQFGLVLSKGSAPTACVSQAVDALRQDGTLAKLQQQWLTASAGAPELN